MGVTKTAAFTDRQNRIAEIAKVLGHPARVAILEVLLRRTSCVCGDIVSELPLAQATVSQHLKELKAVGLIKGEVEGTSVCYCIDGTRWREAENIFQSLFEAYTPIEECC